MIGGERSTVQTFSCKTMEFPRASVKFLRWKRTVACAQSWGMACASMEALRFTHLGMAL